MMTQVEIISIGDELLLGNTVNTNAFWMGEQLVNAGFRVSWITTIGDVESHIVSALKHAKSRADIILVTGGLGPTHDDVTKKAACQFFNSKLILNEKVYNQIKDRFRQRGIPMAPVNKIQAMIPDKAKIIENSMGTAPGMLFQSGRKNYYFMPGVPHEMRGMMTAHILPHLAKQNSGNVILSKFLYTTGIPESTLAHKMGNIAKIEKYVRVAFLPGYGGVRIRLLAQAPSMKEAQRQLLRAENMIMPKIGAFVYSQESELLEETVASLLTKDRKTIAIAESCTGGLLCNRLTNIAGSSVFFERGVVTYSNESKHAILGVPERMLKKYGAVSPEVACAMARGVRESAKTDYGLSTTGIAGPDGATAEKPVGLVYIGYSDCNETVCEKHIFILDRIGNKERAAQAALNMLRKKILRPNETE
jgi:nicotinamide-nucleotide amidase